MPILACWEVLATTLLPKKGDHPKFERSLHAPPLNRVWAWALEVPSTGANCDGPHLSSTSLRMFTHTGLRCALALAGGLEPTH